MPPISPTPKKRFAVVFLAFCCLAGIAGCSRQEQTGNGTLVQDRELSVAGLKAGIQLELSFSEAGYRLIEVSQQHADVRLTVDAGKDGDASWDAPARRAAPERACIYSEAGPLLLTVTSKTPSEEAAATLRLQVHSLPGTPALAKQGPLLAECLESEAGFALPEPDQHRSIAQVQTQAQLQAQKYQRAAEAWSSRGIPVRAAGAYLQSGWMLARQTSRYTDAVAMGVKARTQYELAHDAVGQAHASMQIAVPRWELSDQGLDDHGVAVQDRIGTLARIERELEAGVAAFDHAHNAFFSAEARSHLGYNYFLQSRHEQAVQTFTAAEEQFRRANEPEGILRAQANRSIVLNQAANYRKAAAAFERLLAEQKPDASTPALADILDNSAAMHSAAGNYGTALPQFVRALQMHEKSSDITGMARSLNGLATTYMRLGLPSAALEYAKQAGATLRKRGGEAGPGRESVELATELISGNAQRALGDLPAATASHRTALKYARIPAAQLRAHLELARDALAGGAPATARREIELARSFTADSSTMQTLHLEFEWARATAAEGDLDVAHARYRELQGKFAAAGAREFEIELLHELARTQFQRGKLSEALALNQRGLELLHSLRLAVANPDLRARLTASYRAAYELRVDLLDSLRARTADAQRKFDLLRQLFAAADEAQAGLVHESSEAKVLFSAAATDVALREIAAEIALRESIVAAMETGTAPVVNFTQLREELVVLRARYDARSPPAPARALFDARDYSTAGLRADTAVLMLLQSSHSLRRFLLTRRGLQELTALQWNPGVQRENAGGLLPDFRLLAEYPHLVVVADPTLTSLPVAALPIGGRAGEALVATHDVTMSLTLRDALRIARLPDTQRRADLTRVALFSDPVFTPYDTRVLKRPESAAAFPALPRLANTADEVRGIAEQLGSAKVFRFSGFEATREAAFSPAVGQSSVLHFATHAYASDQWPNGSGLQLTGFKQSGEPINGFVSTLDLLSRRAATDLVVLSACDTARGDAAPGENVAGLARAFLGGGARRVVATLWKVEDAVTAQLMRAFYGGLAAGNTPAAALSAAQRSVASRAAASPRPAWAAFVLYERAPDG